MTTPIERTAELTDLLDNLAATLGSFEGLLESGIYPPSFALYLAGSKVLIRASTLQKRIELLYDEGLQAGEAAPPPAPQDADAQREQRMAKRLSLMRQAAEGAG